MLRRTSFAIALVAVQAALASPALAEPITLQSAIGNPDHFKLSASVRVRYEMLDGQPRVGFNADDEQLAIRSTLLAEYNADGLRIGAELYDSRAYLSRPGSSISANEVNAAELVQAYVAKDFANPFGPGSKASIQFGRFTLNLGSRRLVAADDYRNTTNGYTGIRADLRAKDGTNATFIYTLPQVRLPDDLPSVLDHRPQWDRESFDLRLWGGIVARPKTLGTATAELSYFRLQERDGVGRPTRDRDLHTIGGRLIRDPKAGAWDYEVEGFYQFGGIRSSLAANAAQLAVSAWFLHADVGYSFSGAAKLRLSVEYDRASGDGPSGTYGRFDTLFGMRRADLAPAGIYNAIGRANISTVGLRAEVAPTKRLDAFAAYRAMWLADRTDSFSTTSVRDSSGQSGNFAGHQVEGRVRYWFVPRLLRGEINGVWLAKGRFIRDVPNAPQTGDTHYLATALTATF